MSAEAQHVPVMLDRIIELLAPALDSDDRGSSPILIDCTTGLGGHCAALLEACPGARLIGLDRDPDALAVAGERLRPYGARVRLVHAVYDELAEVVAEEADGDPVRAILFDLGLSSLQIDRTERGFAYATDAPLDMRMDPGQSLTAAEVLNTYPARELTRILTRYGEERFADRIARRIVAERADTPFDTSARLVELLHRTIPARSIRTGGHPAKRTFQALRIEVNAELAALETALPAAIDVLAHGGRIAVLSYHSLEDRLTKQTLATGASDTAPRGLPVVPAEHQPRLRLLTRGVERPTEAETASNPRAASAKLRAAEKVRGAAHPSTTDDHARTTGMGSAA